MPLTEPITWSTLIGWSGHMHILRAGDGVGPPCATWKEVGKVIPQKCEKEEFFFTVENMIDFLLPGDTSVSYNRRVH